RHAGVEAGAAAASKLESQPAWLQPAVALAKAAVHDVRCQVGKALANLSSAQQLDIGQPPPALRGDQVGLQLSALIRPGDEKIPLVAQAQIHLLLKLIEEGHALPDQVDFLGIAELQPEGAGRYGSGQGGE